MKIQKYKSFVLPVALIGGYFLRDVCSTVSIAVPFVIFGILIFTFSGVRLSRLRPSMLDLWLAIFQTVVSIGGYWLTLTLTSDSLIAQGLMMCILCPVASSVTVVATMLGANPVRTTTYTIVGNLLVAVIGPTYFAIINEGGGVTFLDSFQMVFIKTASVIALPFFVMLAVQKFTPKLNSKMAEIKGISFYLWAFALFVTIGQTADFVVLKWQSVGISILWLGIVSLIICIIQFSFGRWIGKRCGDRIGGGQLLAQKNSAMGIWMTNSFLNPIASVTLAFYSIWQNIFNSWQIYRSR